MEHHAHGHRRHGAPCTWPHAPPAVNATPCDLRPWGPTPARALSCRGPSPASLDPDDRPFLHQSADATHTTNHRLDAGPPVEATAASSGCDSCKGGSDSGGGGGV